VGTADHAFSPHQSGQPGRTFVVRNLNLGTSLPVFAEPIGTRRMDHITLFDAQRQPRTEFWIGRPLDGLERADS
jgi:hypothetical protein